MEILFYNAWPWILIFVVGVWFDNRVKKNKD